MDGQAVRRRAGSPLAETLTSAIEAQSEGPDAPGAKLRDEIACGLMTLHEARKGHRGRHFVLIRISREAGREVIDVLRVLHDAMDLVRPAPSADPDEG